MATSSKRKLTQAMVEALKELEPALNSMNKIIEEAGQHGHEEFRRKKEALEQKRKELDRELDEGWRKW
jgi:F0F1-type ATP synthase membrane subunit b/b'